MSAQGYATLIKWLKKSVLPLQENFPEKKQTIHEKIKVEHEANMRETGRNYNHNDSFIEEWDLKKIPCYYRDICANGNY